VKITSALPANLNNWQSTILIGALTLMAESMAQAIP